jgi:hypothetical protein
VGNHPTNGIDPTGLTEFNWTAAWAGAGGGAAGGFVGGGLAGGGVFSLPLAAGGAVLGAGAGFLVGGFVTPLIDPQAGTTMSIIDGVGLGAISGLIVGYCGAPILVPALGISPITAAQRAAFTDELNRLVAEESILRLDPEDAAEADIARQALPEVRARINQLERWLGRQQTNFGP